MAVGPSAMEIMVMNEADWRGRRVLVTGHTGFKGSWLSLWLHALGAQVTGLALEPDTDPSLFKLASIADILDHIAGDIRQSETVDAALARAQPQVIFHLAAQPLVRESYVRPVETYATNVMGTVHLLDAARRLGGVDAFVCVTSDKCYENHEWIWPYRETDAMGGYDPYSNSKGCAELVVSAYRNSFFPLEAIRSGGMALASARAGNVIGGGDWAKDRLIPDLVRAFHQGKLPVIRSPGAVRPWQHVLDALGGYIRLAERLIDDEEQYASPWNFGPSDEDTRPVRWIVEEMRNAWNKPANETGNTNTGNTNNARNRTGGEPALAIGDMPHEAGLLRLDSSKARAILGWRPRIALGQALEWIANWTQRVDAGEEARRVTQDQIMAYRRLSAL